MNSKLMTSIATVGVIGFATWHYLSPDDGPTPSATPTSSSPISQRSEQTANAINHVETAPAPIKMQSANLPAAKLKLSAMALEFQSAKQLKIFYDRYIANPDGADAETKYYAALAAEQCRNQNVIAANGNANFAGGGGPGGRGGGRGAQAISPEAQLANFTSTLKPNDPNNAQRIDAFTTLSQRCDGFAGLNISQADINKLYASAAAAGNPAAQVKVLTDNYMNEVQGARGVEQRRLSEDQLTQLRTALQSGDPTALQRAGQLLAMSTQLANRTVGSNSDQYNPRDWNAAWTLAACDSGANCSAGSARLLTACATQGQCGYQSLETYMQFNELPPNVYLASQQYRTDISNAIQTGAWEMIGIAAGSGRTVAITPRLNAAQQAAAQTQGSNTSGGMTGGGTTPSPAPAGGGTPRKG